MSDLATSEAVAVETPAAVSATPAVVAAAPAATGFLGATPVATAGGEGSVTPGNFFGSHVQKDGAFVEGWTNGIAEKHPALANQLMRYKTEGDAFLGLENLVKTVGKKTAGVNYPKEGSTPEEVQAFRTAAGVPGRAEEYNFKPENLPQGVQWNDETGKKFAEIMHANHIPAGAAKALVEAHVNTLAEQVASEGAARQAKLGELIQKSTTEFQREWGVDYQTRFEANSDFVTARLTPDELADPALQVALSHPAIVRMVDEARRASREAPLPGASGTVSVGSMSPQQQALEIIKQNPNWRKDAELTARVNSLYGQHAAKEKRKAGR